jgi:hypothetical protein
MLPKGSDKNYDIEIKNAKHIIRRISTHSVHSVTFPLRTLSPHSTISTLHIFLFALSVHTLQSLLYTYSSPHSQSTLYNLYSTHIPLRTLSPYSTISTLHIFLSLSYSFFCGWLMAVLHL